MDVENRKPIFLSNDEMLTIVDWFNGYVSRYYNLNSKEFDLPKTHKDLVNRIVDISNSNEIQNIKHEELANLLEFTAESFVMDKSVAIELRDLLNSIPDEQLREITICDEYGISVKSIMFTRINETEHKAMLF